MQTYERAHAAALSRMSRKEALDGSGRLRIRAIIRAAAKTYGVEDDDITGPSERYRHRLFRIRAQAMLAARDQGYGLNQIGAAFGGRYHTTVLSAVRRAKEAGA